MLDYQIITVNASWKLERLVEKAIRYGWHPIGGASMSAAFGINCMDKWFCQAMIKKREGWLRRKVRRLVRRLQFWRRDGA